MGGDGAAERFWLQLRTLYQAAGQPTLQQLVRLGLAQDPRVSIGHSTINAWLNGCANRAEERALPDRHDRFPPGQDEAGGRV